MNLCWIVPKGEGGHVRDVDTDERAALVRDGYEEFRLICITPSGQREGSLYVPARTNADDFAFHVETAGLALFGGCTSMRVHKRQGATAAEVVQTDTVPQAGGPVP